jgi:hypothetical protein
MWPCSIIVTNAEHHRFRPRPVINLRLPIADFAPVVGSSYGAFVPAARDGATDIKVTQDNSSLTKRLQIASHRQVCSFEKGKAVFSLTSQGAIVRPDRQCLLTLDLDRPLLLISSPWRVQRLWHTRTAAIMAES